ncbi:MAG TPA: macro domain-containing protein [Blastocatellia bacterium]|nr:macro domain-containing protein [Blastocatellia bacterium]
MRSGRCEILACWASWALFSAKSPRASAPLRCCSQLRNPGIIREPTANSLAVAERLGCRSIGFPALATGAGGFPVDQCAHIK